MAKLTLEYWEDEGWLVGRLVEAPGIFSQGETLEELKKNIRDAYDLATLQRCSRFRNAEKKNTWSDIQVCDSPETAVGHE